MIWALHWLSEQAVDTLAPVIPDSWWAIRATKGQHGRYHCAVSRLATVLHQATRPDVGWVKGHSNHRWNDVADNRANQGRDADWRMFFFLQLVRCCCCSGFRRDRDFHRRLWVGRKTWGQIRWLGVLALFSDGRWFEFGGRAPRTNNEAELLAVNHGLKFLKAQS